MAAKVECGKRVEGQNMAYPCCAEQDHGGPCAAVEIDRTMRARARWVDGEKAKAILAASQGEPQTTAQRYTENPTPVPRSKGQKANDRRDALEAIEEAERERVEALRLRMAKEAAQDAAIKAEQPVGRDSDPWGTGGGFPPGTPGNMGDAPITKAMDLAKHRANLVAVIGEDAVKQIEAGVEGGMAAALKVMGDTLPPDTAPTKTRKGDQRLPLPRATPAMHVLVAEDLAQRLQVGVERYGQPLQALNGRDAFQDLYEEILDASVYLRQVREERTAMGVLASTLRNRLGYLERVLADLQIEAHTTYDEKGPLTDTPVEVVLVHADEMRSIEALVTWLTT